MPRYSPVLIVIYIITEYRSIEEGYDDIFTNINYNILLTATDPA